MLRKRIKYVIPIIVTFIALLYFLAINIHHQRQQEEMEITFISPRDAVIFWKTKSEDIGFIRYGTSKKKRNQMDYQTSSEPAYIHAVVLENIPKEGYFISLHSEKDNPLVFPKILKLVYNPKEHGHEYIE